MPHRNAPLPALLSSIDGAIHSHFRSAFPTLNVSVLSDAALKSAAAKLLWRNFCTAYSDNPAVKDFNFGTLLRLDARFDYDNPDNVTIVPKIQWLAIEIARNREGKNDALRPNGS
jgi:hypothetical protein